MLSRRNKERNFPSLPGSESSTLLFKCLKVAAVFKEKLELHHWTLPEASASDTQLFLELNNREDSIPSDAPSLSSDSQTFPLLSSHPFSLAPPVQGLRSSSFPPR